MKKLIATTLIALLVMVSVAQGQDKKEQDKKSIKEMCGCYKVTFNFAETFSPDTAYEFHENYRSGGLEWVTVAEESADKIALQHLLVISDSMIIKHWRQDWLYENTEFYMFDRDRKWKYTTHQPDQVKGQWTQKVYQVDDSPRYEGTGTWVHVDGRHFWESTTDAPLPRREFTKRSDYNVMVRRNRHEITEYGHVHEQDNEKVIRSESDDRLLAREKGWNTYEKVDDAQCQPAKDWWEKNAAYWADVRKVWDEVFAANQDLVLRKKVDDKMLWQALFQLGDEAANEKKYKSKQYLAKIRETINAFRA